jgi:outer membrane receptor protein involved in Fe transport
MVESRMTMGGDNFDRQIMTNYVHRNDTGDTKFDFSAYGQNASATELGPNGDNQANRNYDNSDNYFLYTSHDFLQGNLAGLTTGLIVMNKNDGLGEFWDGPGSSDNKDDNIEWNEVIPYVKYKRELNENNTFDGYVKMNYSMEKGYYGDPGSISRYTAHTDDGEDMMEITSKLPWDITSIVGVDNDAREDYLSSDGSFEKQGVGVVMMNSAYFQLRKDFPVLKNLNVTVGGRYDEEDVPDDKLRNERVSPRVAFVEQVTDNWFLKYFHEEALRAPGGKEIGLNEETLGTEGSHIDGLPVLHPETMKTDEVDLMFANKSESFVSSVGYFWDQTANSLDGASGTDNVGNPYNYFQNDPGVIRTEGYEWDMRYAVTKKFQIMANTSFANPRNANGTSMADVPSQMANLILSYDWMPIRMRSAFILRWVKDYRVDNDQGPNGGYTVCDLNFNFPIFKHISLGLQFKNLLDKRFYYPQSDQEDVPLSGRTVLGTVEIHF